MSKPFLTCLITWPCWCSLRVKHNLTTSALSFFFTITVYQVLEFAQNTGRACFSCPNCQKCGACWLLQGFANCCMMIGRSEWTTPPIRIQWVVEGLKQSWECSQNNIYSIFSLLLWVTQSAWNIRQKFGGDQRWDKKQLIFVKHGDYLLCLLFLLTIKCSLIFTVNTRVTPAWGAWHIVPSLSALHCFAPIIFIYLSMSHFLKHIQTFTQPGAGGTEYKFAFSSWQSSKPAFCITFHSFQPNARRNGRDRQQHVN